MERHLLGGSVADDAGSAAGQAVNADGAAGDSHLAPSCHIHFRQGGHWVLLRRAKVALTMLAEEGEHSEDGDLKLSHTESK